MESHHLFRGTLALLLAVVFVFAGSIGALANETARERINAAELDPTPPQSDALGVLLDELMPTIIDDDMDTYEQVKACYDYLVANTRYGSHMSNLHHEVANGVTARQIYNAYGEVEGLGAEILVAHVGMCNAYNAGFIVMARWIGLEANLAKGYTRSAGGGYAYHEWSEVTIDGVVYVFDPQLEQNLVASGLARYTVFCKTYDEVGNRYSK